MLKQKIVNLGFYPVMLGCVCVSTYATYKGLKPVSHEMTPLFTAVIFLFLVLSLTAFHSRREEEKPTAKVLAFFALALVFSTASNINFFYTNFLQGDLARTGYQVALQSFKIDIEDAKKRLNENKQLTDVVAKAAKVEALLTSLTAQTTDPLRQGPGPLARSIIADIRHELPGLPELAVPSIRKDGDYSSWLNRFSEVVRATLHNTVSEAQRNYLKLVVDMDTDYESYTRTGERLNKILLSGSVADETQKLLAEMDRKLVDYQGTVNRLVITGTQPWSPPRSIDPEAWRIGDVFRTIHSAFSENGYIGIFFAALFTSLAIDCMPLLYALMLVAPVKPEEEGEWVLDAR